MSWASEQAVENAKTTAANNEAIDFTLMILPGGVLENRGRDLARARLMRGFLFQYRCNVLARRNVRTKPWKALVASARRAYDCGHGVPVRKGSTGDHPGAALADLDQRPSLCRQFAG